MTQPLSGLRNASIRALFTTSTCVTLASSCGTVGDATDNAAWQAPNAASSSEAAASQASASQATSQASASQTVGHDSVSPANTSNTTASSSGTTASTTQAPTIDPNIALAAGARPGFATRITKSEYKASVLDALNVTLTDEDLAASAGALPDDAGDGVFKRFGDKQTTVEQHAAGLLQVAQVVAERADVASLMSAAGACRADTTECAQTAIGYMGKQLFRRSLDARELDVFAAIGAEAFAQGEELEAAVRWALVGLLQAPQFVFQLTDETSGVPAEKRPLAPTELSARLASFIWNSVPDAELLEAAEDGTLSTTTVLDAQVARMLQSPKARRMTENFIRDFSRAEKASFVDATDADREALRESMVETFQAHVWDAERSMAELFTTTDFVVNARTAELLGLTPSSPGLRHVDVGDLPERVGILTHPGSLAGMGDQLIGSLVNRGKYLMERLLCQHPIAVPAALAAALEEFKVDTTGLNELERVAIRKTRPECWACHAQFEPFAFGFVRFDGAGRYLGEEDDAGKPLTLDGWVPVTSEADAPHYTNVAEYMQILATEPRIQECMTEHFLSYATAFSPDALTRSAAAGVGDEYKAGGQTIQAMVTAVVHSDLFGQLLVQAGPTASEGN